MQGKIGERTIKLDFVFCLLGLGSCMKIAMGAKAMISYGGPRM
jgi:hypothetical protein